MSRGETRGHLLSPPLPRSDPAAWAQSGRRCSFLGLWTFESEGGKGTSEKSCTATVEAWGEASLEHPNPADRVWNLGHLLPRLLSTSETLPPAALHLPQVFEILDSFNRLCFCLNLSWFLLFATKDPTDVDYYILEQLTNRWMIHRKYTDSWYIHIHIFPLFPWIVAILQYNLKILVIL